MGRKQKIGLIGLFTVFMILLNSPIILLPKGLVGSTPTLMIYFGVIWIVLIVSVGIIFNKNGRQSP